MIKNKVLIMPKQTGQFDAFLASLKLYYKSFKRGEEWYSNTDFKIKILEELPNLTHGKRDKAQLVKQSELTRYFDLAYYDYSKRIGRAKITKQGIKFYEAYLNNDKSTQVDIIMHAIINHSFGRNNTAIESSDSNIDPPKLFIKAIYDLNGITKKEFAYLLYVIHDLEINYNDAIVELLKTNDRDREIPLKVANKYTDVKFNVFLTEIGITTQGSNKKYYLSKLIQEKYINQIKSLSIYNKEPDYTLTLNENDLNSYNSESCLLDIAEKKQEQILVSFVYDTQSFKFKQQNNRVPQSYKKGNVIRFKTNFRIAKTAIDLSNYKCEFEEKHDTFISKLGKPYMEAHHLIPMAAQKDFKINIDRIENIVSLCPVCHSGIHLGNDSTRLELLKKIYDLKKFELENIGIKISFGELFTKYYK